MRAGFGALVATGLILGPLAPAGAAAAPDSGIESNYWWKAESSGAVLPAPPNVPAGGLWVASDPTGPEALSAVRFTLLTGFAHPVLTLDVDSAQPSTAAVVACPATSEWTKGAGPSPWAARPASDCSRGAVTGAYSANGHTVTFDLSSVLSPTVDVVIQAAPLAIGTPAESVTFAPVVPADVTASQVSVPGSSNGPPTTAAPTPDTTIDTAPAVAAPGLGGASQVATGSVPSFAVPAPVAATSSPTTAPHSPTLATPASGRSAVAAAPVLAAVRGRSWRDRILLGVAIFDIALYLLWQKRPEPAVATARVGKPPALR